MALELVYTSVPKGLKPGTYGFCTVACSRKLPDMTISTLEKLSGYRRASSDPKGINPVVYSYLFVEDGGPARRVLSRVGDAGVDYSGRTNKIACHFVLESNDMGAAGPARVCAEKGLFVESWNEQPRYFENEIRLPSPSCSPLPREEWRRVAGDSGWAGILASTSYTGWQVCLIVSPTHNVLRLYQEAFDLVPVDRRWNVTFSTYYTKTLPGVQCQWKAALEGSPEESTLRSLRNALILDLTNPDKLPSPDLIAKTEIERRLLALARSDESARAPEPAAPPPFPTPIAPRVDDAATTQAPPTIRYIDEPSGFEPPPISPPPVLPVGGVKKPDARIELNQTSDEDDRAPIMQTAARSLLWLALGAILAFAAMLVVMASYGKGPLKGLVRPESEPIAQKPPVAPQNVVSDGDDGIGEDLPDIFDSPDDDAPKRGGSSRNSRQNDDFDPFAFDDDSEKTPTKKNDGSGKTSTKKNDYSGKTPTKKNDDSFIPKDWDESDADLLVEEEEDDAFGGSEPIRKERVDAVDTREFKAPLDLIELVDAGEIRADFNIMSPNGSSEKRYDLTGDVKEAMKNAWLFCKERRGKIAVSCDIEADVYQTRRFKDKASGRVETREIDFAKRRDGDETLTFEVVSAKNVENVETLTFQFNDSDDYAGLLTIEASSESARDYFLSVAKLKWTLTIPTLDGGKRPRVFESKETQLLKPRAFKDRDSVFLTPYYQLASELGESQPNIVDEESLANPKKKYAIVIKPDKGDENVVESDASKAKTVDFAYSLDTPYSDTIEFMTIRFAKSKNARFLEIQKFYDKDELELKLNDYYYGRIQAQLDRKSGIEGEPLRLAEPDVVEKAVRQSVARAVEQTRDFRDSPRRFELYLAPTNDPDGSSVDGSAQEKRVLLGTIEIARGTEFTPYPRKR